MNKGYIFAGVIVGYLVVSNLALRDALERKTQEERTTVMALNAALSVLIRKNVALDPFDVVLLNGLIESWEE